MPARTALRVIQHTFNGDCPVYDDGKVTGTSDWRNEESIEASVLGAYQTLADEMGATLEVTLDGQVVLYTGYFKPSLQGFVDLYDPKKYIEARDPTPEDLTSEDYSAEQQLRWKKDAELSY